jgi:regulator of sigma E protease
MIISILAFLVVFTVIVCVHEYGHFMAARLGGIRVYEFSIGFPFSPRIATLFHHKETAFTLRLLPLGGFVRFSSEDESAATDLESTCPWKRAFVLAAGSLSNMLCAVVLFFLAHWIVQRCGPATALFMSIETAGTILSGTVLLCVELITGQGGAQAVSGPVGIATAAGEAAAKGAVSLVFFTGVLNMSLGIVNLLPLPALDGGHLMVLIYEWLVGKPLDRRVYAMMTTIGLVLFLAVTVIITIKDIGRLLV